MAQGDGLGYVCHQTGGKFRQDRVESYDELIAAAQTYMSSDVWYSCARFDGSTRSGEDAIGAWGFWADLDIGEGSNKYATTSDAIAGLKAFCISTGLPKPSVITSGYGYHIYWLVDAMVPKDEWIETARRFKNLAHSEGLKADPTRTADITSILRVPGGQNYKDKANPVPVTELATSEPMTLAEFQACLPAATKPKREHNESDSVSVSDFPPCSGEVAAESCAQLGLFRDSKGNIEEPLWYAGIGVLAHTLEGDDLIHDWSQGHEGYCEAETDGKVAQWRDRGYGPTTCDRFDYLNPEGCEGCLLKGMITSPIQCGRVVTPVEPEPASTWTKPTEVGHRWRVGKEGVMMKSDDGAPELIIEEPMYIEKIGRIGYGDAVASIHWKSPTGIWHESEMSLVVLGDDKAMRTWLFSHAIISFRKVSDVRNYLKDYAHMLNTQAEPDLICQRFGWDGAAHFMLGGVRVSKEAVTPTRVDAGLPKEMRTHLVSEGSLDAWAEATELFQEKAHWKHSFALLASLAAPIFQMTDISGAVASFAGESGSGKTTATSFGLSVWGHPKALTASPQGTMNSKGELLRSANNLPLLVDDVSSYNKMLSSLIYMAANGKAKERVSRTGKLYGQEDWQTVMFLTTNTPVLDLPESIVGEAERRRVLEFDMNAPMQPGAAILLNEAMRDNYGVAGPPFIQLLIAQRESVIEAFSTLYKSMLADPTIPEANRFGVWLIAAAKVAGDIAAEAGIIRFDPSYAIEQSLNKIRETAKDIRTPLEIVDEAVAAYINENISAVSIIQKRNWLIVPDREVVAIIHKDHNTISIPTHRLKTLMVKWNIPGSYLTKWAEENVVEQKKVLMAHNGSREYCKVINLPDELLADIEEDVL